MGALGERIETGNPKEIWGALGGKINQGKLTLLLLPMNPRVQGSPHLPGDPWGPPGSLGEGVKFEKSSVSQPPAGPQARESPRVPRDPWGPQGALGEKSERKKSENRTRSKAAPVNPTRPQSLRVTRLITFTLKTGGEQGGSTH